MITLTSSNMKHVQSSCFQKVVFSSMINVFQDFRCKLFWRIQIFQHAIFLLTAQAPVSSKNRFPSIFSISPGSQLFGPLTICIRNQGLQVWQGQKVHYFSSLTKLASVYPCGVPAKATPVTPMFTPCCFFLLTCSGFLSCPARLHPHCSSPHYSRGMQYLPCWWHLSSFFESPTITLEKLNCCDFSN